MRKFLFLNIIIGLCLSCADVNPGARQMEQDGLASIVEGKSKALFTTKLNAGDSYGEVWIRDYNTFIETAINSVNDSIIRNALNIFLCFQGEDGNIIDGYIERSATDSSNVDGYKYRTSELAPDYFAHKNSVETDQESSLIQAIYKYVNKSNNREYLNSTVGGMTILERIEFALEYLHQNKTNSQYGLLIGATTADWGDVQPEHIWGVEIDENTHFAIDIYDNAMYVIAINNYLEMVDNPESKIKWSAVRDSIKVNVRRHLWDADNQKFIPHIYLNGSPFPAEFDENQIYYHGGTAVAALAGILSKDEIKSAYERMVQNQAMAKAQTIGLTLYPPYPAGYFKGAGMYPYGYQNGGDWTWFGARMVVALAQNGLYEEAYQALKPMLERVINNDGFYEWYTPCGEPKGSGVFRGEAGVLMSAIEAIKK